MARSRRLIAGAVAAVTVVGCAPSSPAPDSMIRTDTAPIQKRVTNIGDRFTVRWVGGIRGNERVPGPNAAWLDAVISVDDRGTLRGLRVMAGDAPAQERPAISASLEDLGTGLTSAELDAFVAVEPGTVRAFLYPDRGAIVVKYFRG